jgi:hypothetical protein
LYFLSKYPCFFLFFGLFLNLFPILFLALFFDFKGSNKDGGISVGLKILVFNPPVLLMFVRKINHKEFCMKIAKGISWFLCGCLSALVLAACINPLPSTAGPPETGAEIKAADGEPFTVTLTIDAGGSTRAVAGSGVNFIISGGVRNFIQLIVVDKATGEVHALTDARQQNAGDTSASLVIQSISYGKQYEFLLLMGHWERDYDAENGGQYRYTAGPPTLLAVGLTEKAISNTDTTVFITMWPLVVDTKFTGPKDIEAAVGETSLIPGNWNLKWEVRKGNSGNGFEDLVKAQQAINPASGNTLEYKSLTTIVRKTGGNDQKIPTSLTGGSQITQNIGAYTGTVGATGSASFNLKYVPFGKPNYDWSKFNEKSNFALGETGNEPVWIIRNGINDLAQDGDTTFASSAEWGTAANGNGAVTFKVLDPAGDEDGDKYLNGWEVEHGYDPMDVDSHPDRTADSDGDTYTDGDELDAGSDPTDQTSVPISEENLLDVLGVSSVAEAIEELHQRISAGEMDGLKLGMYLDLPSLTPDGESRITLSNENLRIVIASFNQYQNTMGNDDTNHIKFVFKNIPVLKRMRTGNVFNNGGYPYTGGTYGTPELKPYLEGAFFNGLQTALGHDYFYEVTRGLTVGEKTNANWQSKPFAAKIFIDTEKEVFGNNTISGLRTEGALTQTALYKIGGKTWRIKKYNGALNYWWLASPYSASNTYFCRAPVSGGGSANDISTADANHGCVPAFCIY